MSDHRQWVDQEIDYDYQDGVQVSTLVPDDPASTSARSR